MATASENDRQKQIRSEEPCERFAAWRGSLESVLLPVSDVHRKSAHDANGGLSSSSKTCAAIAGPSPCFRFR